MSQLCNVQIHINGQETFFLNEKILFTYSEKLRKIVKQEKRRTQKRNIKIEIDDFPGGPEGFELVSRFCHNNNGGRTITITVTNVALLYCCAVFLGMTEKVSALNLLQKTEAFLEGMFYWSWKEVLSCLKSCESLFAHAESCGLLEKLIFTLLAKIAQNSDLTLITASSSSSSSSPETTGFRFPSSCKATPESVKPSSSSKAWWFDDLAILPPKIVARVVQCLGVYMNNNNSLTLTKFLLHYLKLAIHRIKAPSSKGELVGLADTAVHGVIFAGKKSFSCRSLFWVLRIVSGLGISKELRLGLERLIGEVLDESKLDDLLVCGNNTSGGVYDVNLVIRLVRVFVNTDGAVCDQKMKKVGRLIDKYLCEISPDQNLKVSKFLGVAESVPDSARDCFNGVYRAIDIYLESHPTLSSDKRAKLCRCLNYQKLSLEVCKELAKNPKIPPRIAMQALISQQSKVPYFGDHGQMKSPGTAISGIDHKMAVNNGGCDYNESFVEQNEDVKMNLKRMQRRVVELEKVCREMKGQMSRMVRQNVFGTPTHSKTLPRLC